MNKGIMNVLENKEDEVVYAKVDKTEKIAILDLNCNSAGQLKFHKTAALRSAGPPHHRLSVLF